MPVFGLGVLATLTLIQQPPSSSPAAPRGAFDPARQGALSVEPPGALSRDVLVKRLQAIDKSIPNTLPAGASVVLTPANLRSGRTYLGIYGATLVGVTRGGSPVADFTEYHENTMEGLYVEFDAAGPGRYALDLTVGGYPTAAGYFSVAVSGPTTEAPARVNVTSDAHVLYLFDVARSGRHTITIERPRLDLTNAATGRWYFYRAELVRVR